MLARDEHIPTEEQAYILDLVKHTQGHLLIRAYAGTGKSATLRMISLASQGPILYLVFSKANKEEAEKEFPSHCAVKTFNGLGHGVWGKATGKKLVIDRNKVRDIVGEILKELPKGQRNEAWDNYWEVIAAVGMAKNIGYVPPSMTALRGLATQEEFYARLEERPSALARSIIDAALQVSIKTAYQGLIDFDDQVYMSALFGGAFPSYPLVLVDEKQDLNPCNHVMLDKLRGSRLVGVGDDAQSIYAFRGAVPGGMYRFKSKFKAEEATLSVSFRCPEEVVKNAKWRVQDFKWVKPGGIVASLGRLPTSEIADDAAIICRNNAPLFALAFKLLATGRSVRVSGSDIGPKLVGIMRKLGDENSRRGEVLGLIDSWLQAKLAKGSTTAEDMAACMRIFAEQGETLSQAVAYASHLFKQTGKLQLLTGHKAKGLEFDVVYHLDPQLIRQDQQDLNLRYVIQTRSAREYYEVQSEAIEW